MASAQMLACVSQRLALNLDTILVSAEQLASMRQVQDHMRLCFFNKVSREESALEAMSQSGSEPLLAEAAYYAVHRCAVNLVTVLKTILADIPVVAVNGGQLLTCLLLTLARDATVGEPDAHGRPAPGPGGRSGRIMDAGDFFRTMFTFMRASRVGLIASHTEVGSSIDQERLLADFERDFSDCQMYFNHFVSVPQRVLRMSYLHALLARGAAACCSQLDSPIDAVLTMVEGGRAEKGRVNLILSKAVLSRDGLPAEDTFSAMDPYTLGIWDSDYVPQKPLIRIAFAFDVPRALSGFHIARRENVDGQQRSYASYDIRIAGLSPDTTGVVNADTEQEAKDILLMSRTLKTRFNPDPYRGNRVPVQMYSFSMRPGADTYYEHWHRWTKGVR
ncbi:hypothetical protein EVJ58_g2503 [Rhodofomes roseus]|uniref:Uncharacterized protein n=1 Tax=Rhodofomes roseus TaxID=34475 RepID=A0A4Y9YR52_9APHY|nr:hypothetical protein EVJ58_g2503 [Rhodofomes roseus]